LEPEQRRSDDEGDVEIAVRKEEKGELSVKKKNREN
jgi:hypothetical protein